MEFSCGGKLEAGRGSGVGVTPSEGVYYALDYVPKVFGLDLQRFGLAQASARELAAVCKRQVRTWVSDALLFPPLVQGSKMLVEAFGSQPFHPFILCGDAPL